MIISIENRMSQLDSVCQDYLNSLCTDILDKDMNSFFSCSVMSSTSWLCSVIVKYIESLLIHPLNSSYT